MWLNKIGIATAAILIAFANAETVTLANGEPRVCPDDFYYAGEDTIEPLYSRSYYTEEVDRSEVYSCYSRATYSDEGINGAIPICENARSRVVAFEDGFELRRYLSLLLNRQPDLFADGEVQFLTSGMYFSDIEKWVWLGTNTTKGTIRYDIVPTDEAAPNKEQCLTIRSSRGNLTVDSGYDFSIQWVSVGCNNPGLFVCEMRAQTVTYITWFYSNWLTLLLGIVLMLLLVALCISALSYTSRKPNSRAYRATGANRSSIPPGYNDAPPAYKDVTGSPNPGLMEKYKAKGKELLAKVYLYKDGSSTTTTAPTTTSTTSTTTTTVQQQA